MDEIDNFPMEASCPFVKILVIFYGSAYYSAAATNLISYHKIVDKVQVTLFATNSKLHAPVKHLDLLETVLKRLPEAYEPRHTVSPEF